MSTWDFSFTLEVDFNTLRCRSLPPLFTWWILSGARVLKEDVPTFGDLCSFGQDTPSWTQAYVFIPQGASTAFYGVALVWVCFFYYSTAWSFLPQDPLIRFFSHWKSWLCMPFFLHSLYPASFPSLPHLCPGALPWNFSLHPSTNQLVFRSLWALAFQEPIPPTTPWLVVSFCQDSWSRIWTVIAFIIFPVVLDNVLVKHLNFFLLHLFCIESKNLYYLS